jgi:hypothetical protein
MRRILLTVSVATLSLAWAFAADAQVPDHLKCSTIKDPVGKGAYTADLGASSPLPAESGCVIKMPGKLLCVDTTKTNVSPAPPGAAPAGAAGRFVCYKVKCPKTTLPPVAWTDQFGTRTLQPLGTKMLCAPEAPPPGPPCVTGGCAACGSCGDGRCHLQGGGGGCGTFDNTPQCVSASTCVDMVCNSNAECGPNQVCVFTGSGVGSACCNPCP